MLTSLTAYIVSTCGFMCHVMRAVQCVSLKPDWAKGYSRLGAAYFGLQQYDDAIKAYDDGKHNHTSV